MEVHLADDKGKRYLFKCPKLIPPLHLLTGILKYRALSMNDKLGIVRLVNFIILKKYEDDELKAINLIELFEKTNQPKNLIKMFWDPFILAVFNAKLNDVCAWYFSNIIRMGFFRKDGSRLILPQDTLNKIFVESSENYLQQRNTDIMKQTRVKKINFDTDNINCITLSDGNEFKADYYISAVPFYEFRNIVDEAVYTRHFKKADNLTPSPIINIHHRYINKNGQEALKYDFIGLLGTVIHWVFKVRPDQVNLVISSANEIIEMDKNQLIESSKKELCACIPEFNGVEFIYSRVVKEKRATFLPDINSVNSRPANKTLFNNFFLAGDWTDTGLPSTIESAVLSGKNCAKEILERVS
jgi:hypothetical protein